MHWPWPIDHVFRIPVQARAVAATSGTRARKKAGPENVLWAVEHAAERIHTAARQWPRSDHGRCGGCSIRIVDARAWRYHSQNPADALTAIAYRAVMRNTVNRTLSEALSENVAALTARMRDMVQQDADALGLGVQVVAFTVGGMHPPVRWPPTTRRSFRPSSRKVTAVVNAQAYRNRDRAGGRGVRSGEPNTARAEGARSPGQGGGRGVELSARWSRSIARVAGGILLPAPSGDARERSWPAASLRLWIPAFSGMEVSCG